MGRLLAASIALGLALPATVASADRRSPVVITESRIDRLDELRFERGSAKMVAGTRGGLNAVAKWLRDDESITLIDVVGQAERSEANPIELSWRRAIVVCEYLAMQGVDGSRLLPVVMDPIDLEPNKKRGAPKRTVELLIGARVP